jgi:SHS2 domain-containing protein
MEVDKTNDKYIYYDKTADIKFQAFGPTLEVAFKNAEEALIGVMYDIQELIDYDIHTEDREVTAEADNLERLLYNFLEEIVFLLSAESFIGLVEKIIIKEIDGTFVLKAKIHGTQCINLESHGEVKAVTYNEMHVKFDDKKQQYEVQVVLDI